MKFKTIISLFIVSCLVILLAVPVSADLVDPADAPKDGSGNRVSTGSAVVFGDADTGEINAVIGDDGAYDSINGRIFTEGNDGAQVSVWAKVIEADLSFTIYSIEIEWGNMKFVYSNGKGKWDSQTHSYVGDLADDTPSWWIDNKLETSDGIPTEYYLENGNNKITITNHSNGAIDAAFTYATVNGNEFNDISGADNVIGGFYDSEPKAKSGALILTDLSERSDSINTLPNSKVSLPTAVGRDLDAEALSKDVYFAFSGTPDVGKSAALADFTKVGFITVTIMPNYDEGLNSPPLIP